MVHKYLHLHSDSVYHCAGAPCRCFGILSCQEKSKAIDRLAAHETTLNRYGSSVILDSWILDPRNVTHSSHSVIPKASQSTNFLSPRRKEGVSASSEAQAHAMRRKINLMFRICVFYRMLFSFSVFILFLYCCSFMFSSSSFYANSGVSVTRVLLAHRFEVVSLLNTERMAS